MRSIAGIALVSCSVIVVLAAQGQPPPPGRGGVPQAPKNLHVLPSDFTTQQVTQLMRTFTAGLGVTCDHCHVSQLDRASDDKPEKKTARKMLQMMMAINDLYLKDVGQPPAPVSPPPPVAPAPPGAPPGAPPAPAAPPPPPALVALLTSKVTCYTCHRGTTKPLATAPAGGGH